LKPHVIVETSPGHFQTFWRVDGLPLDQFEDVMRGVAKRFDADPAVATLERCARLPGFFHCKDIENRFRVRIVEVNDLPTYAADQIVAEFPPQKKAHKASGSTAGKLVLPAGAPLRAAEEFVKRCHSVAEISLLRHYRGQFYLWTGTHYASHAEETLERDLYVFLNEALVVGKNGEAGPFNPTKNKVLEVVHALRRGTMVRPEWDVPCWLRNLVACRNGILNLETRELATHDPLFFATNCLPLDYDPAAPKPKRFRQFLEELWPADENDEWDREEEDTLQEIFGYLLTSDTRQQKIFLITGPKRGGKGTIVFVLEHLLGKDNVVYQTLSSIAGEFGRWPLIDKKLAVVADARLGSRTSTSGVAETLLSVSGGDPQTINRKFGPFWTGRLAVRFLITTNVLPAIRDASGTIASRFIMLKLTESFFGREDTELQPTLLTELSGILNWALDGLDRLRKRGYFRQPASSRQQIRLLEDIAAPVGAFLREWCEQGPDARVKTKELHRAYKSWSEETGQKALAAHMFGKELRDFVPTLHTSGVGARRNYVGVALSAEGRELWDQLLVEKGGRR
jgi:putative DNA primase/helicase